MASECCLSLTKYFLFLFNLIFFLLGSLLLSLGLWILFSETSIFMPPSYISVSLFSYLLIISGSVTMSLGFIGCLGSLKTVKCLLAIYFILLTVLLAAQIVGGVLFYTQKSELVGSLKDHTFDLIKTFKNNNSSLQGFKQTLEYIQMKTKCCGWQGKQDWEDSIPCSCVYTSNVTVNATHKTEAPMFLQCSTCFSNVSISNNTVCSIYEQGCSDTIKKWLDENVLFILVVILTISVVEICGMILSMCLYKAGSVDYNTIFY
ncbi:leukocyte antigen CD37 [Megalobrama amblycephala]|uniref:leukocyte antigen CD37 n=1 Tax=Megalobrama amblycephala TaxID=75352 RepID=UPI002013F72A|nr:leukocyte antigen CD37 [Megalobrama amblycephala]XP_048027320.1 leukocyte antigen CD37 [Megalobrama amblycephala]